MKRTETLARLADEMERKFDEISQRMRSPVVAQTRADNADHSGWIPQTIGELLEARQRVEQGKYGCCVDCERNIPLARLRIKPFAVRCTTCQASREMGLAIHN